MSTPDAKRSVALLGGTFDPIHRGHLDLAKRVLALFPVDKLYLCPARQNPLKEAASGAAPEDRLAMVRLAIRQEGSGRLEALDYELLQPGPSFTLFTVRHLKSLGTDVVLVMGNEVFQTLARWHEPRALLNEANLLVVTRDAPVELLPTLTEIGLGGMSLRKDGLRVEHGNRWVERHTIKALPVSATAIRESLAANPERCPEGLHGDVWKYIKEKGLYAR